MRRKLDEEGLLAFGTSQRGSKPGAGIMEADDSQMTTVFTVNRHSTIGPRQTEYHEVLPSSANDEVRCDCTFADDGNASWCSVCRVPTVEWRLDSEDCRHLKVVGLRDEATVGGLGLPRLQIACEIQKKQNCFKTKDSVFLCKIRSCCLNTAWSQKDGYGWLVCQVLFV